MVKPWCDCTWIDTVGTDILFPIFLSYLEKIIYSRLCNNALIGSNFDLVLLVDYEWFGKRESSLEMCNNDSLS